MKKTILLASLLVVSWTAAYSDDDPKTKKAAGNYCAKMKDGMLRVEHDGTVLTEDVTLSNGTQIKTDGTIIKKDGTRSMLKDGQCVDLKGDTNDDFNGSPAKGKNKNNNNFNGGSNSNGNSNNSGAGNNGSSKVKSSSKSTGNSNSGSSKSTGNSTDSTNDSGNDKK